MKTTLKTLICAALCCSAWSAFAGAPPPPNASTAITFTSDCTNAITSASPTDPVVVKTTTTSSDPAITAVIDDGKVQLQIAANNNTGEPTTVSDPDLRWVRIDGAGAGTSPSGGVACFPVDLDGLFDLNITWTLPDLTVVRLQNVTCDNTTVGFRANYITGGGNPHADNHFSAGTPLTIECDECGTSEDLTLSEGNLTGPSQVAAPLPNTCWTYTFTVENCTDSAISGIKVQGGTSGWTTLNVGTTSATSGSFVVKNNNKNSVITWTLDLASGESASITVGVCGSLKASACGTTQFLSGPWSAVFIDPDTNEPVKTDYTDRFSIGVVCP
jgi:hypothetical protein